MENLPERKYLTAVCAFTYFGPVRVNLLIKYFESAKGVWQASKDELVKVGLKEKVVFEFDKFRNNFNIKRYFESLEKLGVQIVTIKDKNYPSHLLEIEDPPLVLYVLGDTKTFGSLPVAVVGARKMTSYGREVAEKVVNGLVNYGVTIVSGFARGIDTASHKAAISAGGKTIAVLPCGIDIVYPPENHQLYKEIIKNGCIISEYPLSAPPVRINFASRNRIISGLSRIVIVVEGEKKSGTLLTASKAADQGRTVFAVPGSITSPMSAAPHFLIQNGAKILFGVEDVVKELDLDLKIEKGRNFDINKLDINERKILEIIEKEETHLDEIVRILELNVSQVSATLMVMQLKGIVKNLGEGIYKKV